ncbi:hypothetical protein ACLOJK_007803 [Asimina triloba]
MTGRIAGCGTILSSLCGYVSEDFDVKRLTKAIIEEAEGTSTSLTELNSLQNQLLKALSGKQFLLVLDDVWNEDKEKWNRLILVTTRLHKVAANAMNAVHIHELQGLSDNHSWSLFSSIAFDGKNAEEHLQLESVGREIVNKCKGVPLSIKWIFTLVDSSGFFSSGLPDLPNLKKFEMRSLRIEMLPDEGWERLVLRSLTNLDVRSCSKLESVFEGLGQLKKLKSLTTEGSEALTCLPDSLGKLESLEYLKILDLKKLRSLPDSLALLQSLKELRMSGLLNLEFLPQGLGQLKKLTWLTIIGAETLTQLPDSVTLLESLERFRVMNNEKLESLPHSLGQLKKLKSLEIRNMEALAGLPDSMGQIESLRELEISYCPKLKALPPHRFPVQLQRLRLSNLEALIPPPPHVLGSRLQSLEELILINLKEFESFSPWLGQLKVLTELTISDCTALRCSKLPHELRRLPLLQHLAISNCPLLLERCRRKGGEDWFSPIKHTIYIEHIIKPLSSTQTWAICRADAKQE